MNATSRKRSITEGHTKKPVDDSQPNSCKKIHPGSYLEPEENKLLFTSETKPTQISTRGTCLIDNQKIQMSLTESDKKARGKEYFIENLSVILDQKQVLGKCSFFQTPILLKDGSKYTEIKTIASSNKKRN